MTLKRLEPESWRRKFNRALLIGPPNSWKTTSLKTWPKPIAYIAYPGELGLSSVPMDDQIQAWYWEHDPVTKQSPGAALRAVDAITIEILSGKHGEFATFAGDGLHKLYELIYAASLSELENGPLGDKVEAEKLRGMAYGRAHNEFRQRIQLVSQSTISNVVMTAWSSMEKDDPENARSKKHVWPGLPGTMGQDVVGEFGAVLYAKPGTEIAPGKYTEGQWQTRRHGDVWGVGLKLPVNIATKIPTFVKQDWVELASLVEKIAREEDK
jgi:hypothetical protein